jgi:hypothetical protein
MAEPNVMRFRTSRASIDVPWEKAQLLIGRLHDTEGGSEAVQMIEHAERRGVVFLGNAKRAVVAAINAIGMRPHGFSLLGVELIEWRDELQRDLEIPPFEGH